MSTNTRPDNKADGTVRYFEINLEDALAIAQAIELKIRRAAFGSSPNRCLVSRSN
ncbi:MAG: hypothetical protein AAFO77_02430 [Pseudomonadota bacterium]